MAPRYISYWNLRGLARRGPMKVMFTCQPALGHFHPMVPLAQGLRDAGHDVVFVSSASFVPFVQRTGLTAIAAGLDWLESDVERSFPDLVDDANGWSVAHWDLVFSRAAQALVPNLISLVRSLRPD